MQNTTIKGLVFFYALLISSTLFGQISLNPSGKEAGVSLERLARYDQYLMDQVIDGKMAGAVSMVLRKNQLVHQRAIGFSDLTAQKPMELDELFYIQSMTKPIITIAFMMLYEEGHFLLTDPVAKYLPYFKDLKVAKDVNEGINGETEPAKREMTIAHLLSHTAGLSHGLGSSKLDRDLLKGYYFTQHPNVEARVRYMAQQPLVGHPGEQWYYSTAPDVLSVLIEKFSGQSTAEFLQQRIFDPLGMEDTGYNLDEGQLARRAKVHAVDKSGNLVASANQPRAQDVKVFSGTHGLFSTAGDYLKFCQMLLNGGSMNNKQFLSPKTVELMTSNQVGTLYDNQDPGHGFGFGFAVLEGLGKTKNLGSVGQYFWNGAYCTYFIIDPKEELIAVLLTQSSPYSNFFGKKMRQMVYQAIVD